ncbi:unnamed protein product [Ceutorhynchus assimilis]|uniref:Uncharacterized protein n=1 Tax=Ceutorhynchus assimilis TaxID=467358 RepID=A0A9N9MM20_9CUCU|nr:unnamed protein product [Ceutorhynchus assimilis]
MGDFETFRSHMLSRPKQKDSLTYIIYKGQKYYIDISKLKTERSSQHVQHRSSTISSDSIGSEDSNGYLIMRSPLQEENNNIKATVNDPSLMTKIEITSTDPEKNESSRKSAGKKCCQSCCNVLFWTSVFTTPLTVSALLMYFLFNNIELLQ